MTTPDSDLPASVNLFSTSGPAGSPDPLHEHSGDDRSPDERSLPVRIHTKQEQAVSDQLDQRRARHRAEGAASPPIRLAPPITAEAMTRSS